MHYAVQHEWTARVFSCPHELSESLFCAHGRFLSSLLAYQKLI